MPTTVGLAMSIDQITDMPAFKVSFCDELLVLSASGPDTLCTVLDVQPGSTIVSVLISVTVAQVLQRFADLGGALVVSPEVFPIFSRTTHVELLRDIVVSAGGTVPYETSYDEICHDSLNCLGLFGPGACVKGLCGCVIPDGSIACQQETLPFYVQPDMVCVSGVTQASQYADVCVHAASTTNHIEYMNTTMQPLFTDSIPYSYTTPSGAYQSVHILYIGPDKSANATRQMDECTQRNSRYTNIYPRRRFCQDRGLNLHIDPFMVTGVFGNPYSTNGNDTLRLFALGLTQSVQDLVDHPPVVELGFDFSPQAPDPTIYGFFPMQAPPRPGIFSTYGYVSDLYDGKQPVRSKAWAHIQFRYLYSNTTVQLTRLTFVDDIEGDGNYYFQNNTWNYLNGVPSNGYAYLNQTTLLPQWECRKWYVYDEVTNKCEPGCDNGMTGLECNESLDSCVVGFNAYTAYLPGYSCVNGGVYPVCKAGSALYNLQCAPVPLDDVALVPHVQATTSEDTLEIALLVCLIMLSAGIAGMAVYKVHIYRSRSTKFKRLVVPSRMVTRSQSTLSGKV